jgi:hypothetical protein
MPGRNYQSSTPYRYGMNGHEKDDEIKGSGNHLSFGDYGYDPRIGRRWNVEPLIKKYPFHSSYLTFANNPILFSDPDGRDIIVLSYGEKDPNSNEHRWGHQAMLIGNDKDGWNYYSLDGDYFPGAVATASNNDYTIKPFKTLKEFADSEHNTFKSDYDDGKGKETAEKDKDGNVKQRYKQAFRIETSKEVDAKMNEAAKETTEKGHSWTINNCTSNVENALDAGGLKNGENTEVKTFRIPFTNKSATFSLRNYLPQTKQKEIESSNVGTDVDAILVPAK